MPSVNDYSESLWRVSISDSPRHKSRKQLYYPKKHFSKRQVRRSASALEHRHKLGEIDLWKMDIKITGDKVSLRQLEGENVLHIQDVFNEWIASRVSELSAGTLNVYRNVFKNVTDDTGNFNISAVNDELLNQVINEGKLYYRKSKYSVMKQVFEYARDRYEIPMPNIKVSSNMAERKAQSQKNFKDFLLEAQVLEIVDHIHRNMKHPNNLTRDRVGLYYLLLFYIPRRRSDFLNLKPEWLKGDVLYIGDKDYVPKSQSQEIVMPPPIGLKLLKKAINKYGAPGDLVFPFGKSTVSDKFRIAVEEVFPNLAGLVTLHKLRDSGIMHLIYEEGMSIPDIMSITGHTSISSLEKYIHKAGKAIISERKQQYDVNRVLQLKSEFL